MNELFIILIALLVVIIIISNRCEEIEHLQNPTPTNPDIERLKAKLNEIDNSIKAINDKKDKTQSNISVARQSQTYYSAKNDLTS